MEQDDRRAQHTIKFLYRLCARSESSYARYGLILPFDRAIQEFYTQAKAHSPVNGAISASSPDRQDRLLITRAPRPWRLTFSVTVRSRARGPPSLRGRRELRY